MTSLIPLALYVVGYVFTYRKIYVALYESDAKSFSMSKEDRAANAGMALVASLLWPGILVGFAIWRYASPVPPSQRAAELRQREKQLAEAEAEVARRLHDLNIHDGNPYA